MGSQADFPNRSPRPRPPRIKLRLLPAAVPEREHHPLEQAERPVVPELDLLRQDAEPDQRGGRGVADE